MYDVLIVGAGSSGSVLASRLSENPDRNVLLVEAGPAPRSREEFPREIRMVSDRSSYAIDHPNNWAFSTELLPGRNWRTPRGRILGGSSAINGGYFMRGRAADYNSWGPGWSWDELLPLFRKLETDHDFTGPLHGADGPTPVRRAAGPLLSPLSVSFIEACTSLGFTIEADKNGADPPGVGLVPGNVDDGLRVNSAISHLLPHLKRKNLEIRGDTLVHRVIFDGRRATGVEVASGQGVTEIIQAREVVLSAGAFKSPHILLLSGIGSAEELRKFGIDVVVDLPGVGRGWADDPNIFVHYRTEREICFDSRMLVPQAALNYDSGGYQDGDSELLLFVGPLLPDRLSVMYGLHQESSRGDLSLISANPGVGPEIKYNYLSVGEDLRRFRDGVRLIVDVLRSAPFKDWCAEIADLNDQILRDDAQLNQWIRSNLATTVHAQGSAAMGSESDKRSVVDFQLRVHGVEGLRVVDTSVIPAPLHRGPSATAMLLGERASQFF